MCRVLGSAAAATDVVLVNNNIKSMRKWWAVYICGGDRWTCAQSSLNWESSARLRRARLERASERARETLRMRAGTGNTRAHTHLARRATLGYARTQGIPCARRHQRTSTTPTTKTVFFILLLILKEKLRIFIFRFRENLRLPAIQ